MDNSLDRIVNLTIPVGATQATESINLPKGTIMGVVKYDNGDAPGFMQVAILKSGQPVVKTRHHKAFERSGGGRFIDQYHQLFIDADATFEVVISTDEPVKDAPYKMQMEFKIAAPEQLPLFNNQ